MLQNGNVSGLRIMREFEKGLAAAEARHRQILDSARGFAIIVLDREGRVTTWNDGARRILGWSEEEMHVDEITLMLGRQTRQLTRLVDDLKDLSRITTGKIELKKEQTSLDGILNSAIETCRPSIEEAHHQLSVKLPGETTELEADPVRLAWVFANLLTNAVKFTNPGGQIEVTLATSAPEYIVSVKDAGVGIPPDMLHKVFNMFTQISHPLHRAQGGLGIGLAWWMDW